MTVVLDDNLDEIEEPPPRVQDLPGLGRLFQREPWVRHAACRGKDTDLFFPARGEAIHQAEAFCAGCVVREACLDYALRTSQRFGIWGGVSERARRRMRRKQ